MDVGYEQLNDEWCPPSCVYQPRPPSLFSVLANPARHAELDGSGTVRGDPTGPRRLQLGSEFTMAMAQSRWRYRSTNKVVEFEEGRLIAWASMGVWRGQQVISGQRWGWLLCPDGSGTRVQHSYISRPS